MGSDRDPQRVTIECSQSSCTKPAAWSYVWPGQAERTYACERCMVQARGISNVMGFTLGDVRKEGSDA